MSLLLLVINFIAYAIKLYYPIKKREIVNIYTLTIWVLGAFCSIIYYQSPLFSFFGTGKEITLLPFVYLYILFLLYYDGIKSTSDINELKACTSPFLNPLIYIISISSLLPFIEHVRELFWGSFSVLAIAETRDDNALGLIDSTYYMSSIGHKCQIISTHAVFLSPILFFYSLIKNNVNKLILFGLLLAFLNPILEGVIMGARGALVSNSMYFFLVYLFVRNLIPQDEKRWLIRIMWSIGLIFVVIFTVITIYRFSDSSYDEFDVNSWLLRYFGESFCNFNNECWYFSDTTGGHNILSYFFNDHGLREHQKLSQITHVRMNVFYTMFGDLLLDFGYLFTFVIIVMFNMVLKWFKSRNVESDIFSLFIRLLFHVIFIQGLFIWALMNRMPALMTSIIICIILFLTRVKNKEIV